MESFHGTVNIDTLNLFSKFYYYYYYYHYYFKIKIILKKIGMPPHGTINKDP